MTKGKLIGIIQGILETEVDLSFRLQLEKSWLETLVPRIRGVFVSTNSGNLFLDEP